jgi:hypothetical protein
MMRTIPIVLAIVMIVGLGVYQGVKADRWSEAGIDALEFAARLDHVPMVIGDWEGEDRQQDAAVLRGAGAVGSVSRVYRNTRTNEQVSIFIICGHSRDVAGHTPEECYPAAGLNLKGEVKKSFLDSEDAFNTAVFGKESATDGAERVRVFWAWLSESDKTWQAPSNAKLHYPGVTALFKVYLITNDTGGDPKESTSIKFARDFIPTLTDALQPAPIAPAQSQQAQPQVATPNANA